MNDINALYSLWLKKAVLDPDLKTELESIKGNEDEILDRFYKNLEFGTGGLRGVIGAGTNRLNVYTVSQATQGLANYLNKNFKEPSVAIAYDSRIKSDKFAEAAAGVLAANGIKVYIYPELMPTPMLSFAVRRLHCSSGIVITASHNPSKYNGYKCYDSRGFQMTDEAAAETYEYIKNVDVFTGVKRMDFDDALAEDMVDFIEDWVKDEFTEAVLSKSLNKKLVASSGIKVLYTPLHGTGNKPVRRVLKKLGVKELEVVKTQEKPDGTFTTCPYPNPEIRQVFEEGLKETENFKADLIIATDPDCDRVGIAVLDGGEYKLMTGNEVGAMLSEYLLSTLKARGELPEKPVLIKTIVTTPLIRDIANAYGAELYDLLTGFKYIGECITELEEKGEADRYVLGMEESYGYLAGTHVRDKDGVVAAMLVTEMAAFCKTEGKTLWQYMESIYEKYGYYFNELDNYAFEGASGMKKMADMMENLRNNVPAEISGSKVVWVGDYKKGTTLDLVSGASGKTGLPSSNVLSYRCENGSTAIVRPSGTEPKIKIYITAKESSRKKAAAEVKNISEAMKGILGI
ncbi:MAG: phospho-sugar mutase [Oscillospiraceae bacterium]|nr:phospho-sugar mutase [Oscillospiraceae bacterium]